MLLIQLKGILQVLYLLGIIFKMNSVGMNAHLVDQKYSEAHKRGGAPQICFDLQQTCTTESLKQPILCCCFLQFHYMKHIHGDMKTQRNILLCSGKLFYTFVMLLLLSISTELTFSCIL